MRLARDRSRARLVRVGAADASRDQSASRRRTRPLLVLIDETVHVSDQGCLGFRRLTSAGLEWTCFIFLLTPAEYGVSI